MPSLVGSEMCIRDRVSLFAKLGEELLLERRLQLRVRLRLGEVFHAVGVAVQFKQFLLRPFAKIQVPKMIQPLTALCEDQRLGRAPVAVQVAGFRVASGPAVGFEVVQVQLVIFYYTADRVAPIVRSADVVALLANCLLYTSPSPRD